LRDKERVKSWKDENEDEDGEGRGMKRRRVGRDDEDDENPERDGKVWFKPGEKRKVAFLKGEVSASGERHLGGLIARN